MLKKAGEGALVMVMTLNFPISEKVAGLTSCRQMQHACDIHSTKITEM